MPRLVALSAGLLSSSVLTVDAIAQSAPPGQVPDAASDNDATALAKKLQNPIGDLYSFPFQNNTNFNAGPNKGTQDILNVQPVIPIHINEDWNVITHAILPLIWHFLVGAYYNAVRPEFGSTWQPRAQVTLIF